MNFRTSCIIACSALLLVISGCTHLRPELQRPPTGAQLKDLPAGRYTGPVMAELPAYIEFTGQLSQWYQGRADQLRETLAIASETTFFGAVVGVLGAAFGSADVAKVAAGLVGGTTLLSSRYQLSIQASNYDRASKAMLCMRDRLADAQVFVVAQSGAGSKLKEVNPTVHALLPQYVRDQVLVVQNKLDKVQRDIVISEPDIEKIKAALGLPKIKGTMEAMNEQTPTPVDTLLANLSTCSAQF